MRRLRHSESTGHPNRLSGPGAAKWEFLLGTFPSPDFTERQPREKRAGESYAQSTAELGRVVVLASRSCCLVSKGVLMGCSGHRAHY